LVGGRFAAPHEAGSVHKLPVSRLLQYYRRPKYQLARDAQLRKGFGQLLDAHRNENGGGQPKRLKGFIQAFIQAGPSGPTLDELEGIFKDTKKPRARVSETVTWVNNKLHELGVSLSIESETVYRVRHKPRH